MNQFLAHHYYFHRFLLLLLLRASLHNILELGVHALAKVGVIDDEESIVVMAVRVLDVAALEPAVLAFLVLGSADPRDTKNADRNIEDRALGAEVEGAKKAIALALRVAAREMRILFAPDVLPVHKLGLATVPTVPTVPMVPTVPTGFRTGLLTGLLTGQAPAQERRSHGEGGEGEDDDGLDGNHFDC